MRLSTEIYHFYRTALLILNKLRGRRCWQLLRRLNGARREARIALFLQAPGHKIREVDPDLAEHVGMLMHNFQTFLPDGSAALHTAKLPSQDGIESIQVELSPADTGTAHHTRETLLVDADGVFDETEVDEGDLEDVEREITLEDAGPVEMKVSGRINRCDGSNTYRMRATTTSERACK